MKRFSKKPAQQQRDSTTVIREIVPDKERGNYLRNIPLFANLNQFEREKLGGALREEKILAGKAVFVEGDPGTAFYIIKEGTAQVSQKDKRTKQVVTFDRLTAGDYFGERSIMTESDRSASVHAHSDLIVWVLERSEFTALFQKDRLDVNFAKRRRVAVSAETEQRTDFTNSEKKMETTTLPTAEMTDEEKAILLGAINKSLLFHDLESEYKDRVAQVMVEKKVSKGDELIREGEEGDAYYVIIDGDFDVFQKGEDGEQQKVDQKGTGEGIGDLALMYNAPRNATCAATTTATVRVLQRSYFNAIMREIGKARMEANMRWLSKIDLLSPLKNRERQKIAEALVPEDIGEGEIVIKEGDEGDALYIIVRGEVSVTKSKAVGEVARLKDGSVFGERALMKGEVRAATVTTTVPTRLLKLDIGAFELLLGPLEDILKNRVASYDRPSEIIPQKSWNPENIKLEDLKVIGVLGKGAYGFVQLVSHPETGATYALKTVSKQRIVDTHQKQHILDEKAIMCAISHPFLIKLHATYRDKDLLYFLLEPSLGGELFPVLRHYRMFPQTQARFYAAQVLLCFEYMHKFDIIYRDLKPENLLLDNQGYIKITDFGFAKRVKTKTWTMCGTPEYLAPEVIASKGHAKGVDWWTLGIFIFEMLASYTPFYGRGDNMKMFDRICRGKFRFPSHFHKDAKALVRGLLEHYPHRRLGVVKGGAQMIKNYPWFSNFDWQALLWRKLKAPMEVPVSGKFDLSHFNQDIKKQNVKAYVDDGTNWDSNF